MPESRLLPCFWLIPWLKMTIFFHQLLLSQGLKIFPALIEIKQDICELKIAKLNLNIAGVLYLAKR